MGRPGAERHAGAPDGYPDAVGRFERLAAPSSESGARATSSLSRAADAGELAHLELAWDVDPAYVLGACHCQDGGDMNGFAVGPLGTWMVLDD